MAMVCSYWTQVWEAPPQLTSLHIAGARGIGANTVLRLPASLCDLFVEPCNRVPAALAGRPWLRLHVMDVFNNATLQVLTPCCLHASSMHCTPLAPRDAAPNRLAMNCHRSSSEECTQNLGDTCSRECSSAQDVNLLPAIGTSVVVGKADRRGVRFVGCKRSGGGSVMNRATVATGRPSCTTWCQLTRCS